MSTTTQSKLKVLNVSEEGRGGGAIYRIAMVAQQCASEIETVVVTPKTGTKFIADLESRGIRYHTVNLHPLMTSISGLMRFVLFFIPEVVALVKVIRQERPQVIHANGSWQYKAIIAAKLTNTPSIWHMNDMWQPKPVTVVFWLLAGWPTHYIFASERTQQYYLSLAKRIATKPYAIVPAPVDVDRYSPRPDKATVERVKYHIVNVGYVNVHKGLGSFIKAAAQLGEKYQFHQIGPILGTRQGFFDALMADHKGHTVKNIQWHGFSNKIPELLQQMDVYLCTSLREASPMAVWEALAAGLPIVSTDVGDVKLIVDQYDCGIVVEVGDVDGMIQAIRDITIDSSRYQVLSINARRAAESEFALKAVSNRYLHFLKEQFQQ